MEIRSLIIPYSKNKARRTRELETRLQSRLDELDAKLNSADFSRLNNAELQEYEYLQKEIRHMYEKKAEGAILRSKIRWIEKGEKPTKYFFNMEQRNYNKKIITELTTSENETIVNGKDILEEIQRFFKKLYSSDAGDNASELFLAFTEQLRVNLPTVPDDKRDELKGELTLEECKKALKSLRNGKSPGDDGFTVEFYMFICFFDLIGQDFLDSVNAAYADNELSISQRRGVITLIPKEDTDLKELGNWRPITLLNVDYKIASKAIASRIESVLPLIINQDQTGFLKERFIGQNIRLIADIFEQTKLKEIPGILLLLDFKKAFDSIEWSFK